MKYKAIVGQIIKEEEYKKYGFMEYPNHDYLNLQEKEYFEETKKVRYKYNAYIYFGLLLLAAILGILSLLLKIKSDYAAWALIVWILSLVAISFWNTPKHKRYWYFDAPLPIEKPYDLKINDEIDINLEVKKCLKLV